MPIADRFVRVYRAANVTEAHVIRGLLEQHDIRVRLRGEGLSSGFGELPAEVIEVEIQVPFLCRDRARELIDDFENHSVTGTDSAGEWRCSGCREANPATFGVCWKCGTPADR